VDDSEGVADDIDAGDREHLFVFGTDGFGMRLCVVVDAVCEGIEVLAKSGILRLIPGFGTFGDAVELDPAIKFEVGGAPVFGGAATGFAVETEEEIGLVFHLSPAVGAEHFFAGGGVDVGDAVVVPEDFSLGTGQSPGGEEDGQGERAHMGAMLAHAARRRQTALSILKAT